MPLTGEAKRTWALDYVRRPDVRARNAGAQKVRRDYITSALATRKLEEGCTDCGLRHPEPSVFEWDHVRGEKVADVRWLIGRASFERIMSEVEKCEVVCANCHRVRTASRKVG